MNPMMQANPYSPYGFSPMFDPKAAKARMKAYERQ